ncbi:MAG: DUF6088 family protein [Woeseiaceae bacterium]
MKAVGAQISRRIQGRGRGAVWTPKDFLDLGSRAAVDQALRRLVQKGVLRRVDRGVYSYPTVSSRLGPLAPSPDAVAHAVAKATGSKLQVSGAKAANVLGLSTQVPAKNVYLTDGPSRTVRVGRQTVQLKHASARKLYGAGTGAGLALQALRYLGPRGIDDRAVRTIGSQLNAADKRRLARAKRMAPDWIRTAVDQIANKS